MEPMPGIAHVNRISSDNDCPAIVHLAQPESHYRAGVTHMLPYRFRALESRG